MYIICILNLKYIYIYMYIYIYIIYIYLYIYIYNLKSQKSKMDVICMKSWKLLALPIITTMAVWQPMHVGATVHHLHHDNLEGTLLS